MLSYLIKLSRPDIANATFRLSKVVDDANPAAFLEILHVNKYVLGISNLLLKI